MEKRLQKHSALSLLFAAFIFGPLLSPVTAGDSLGLLATKESRRTVVCTEAGEIAAVDVSDGRKYAGSYHLEFFTLDTRSLFLPVLLHTEMLFYVLTGKGTISWTDKKKAKVLRLQVEKGDIYRLEEGEVFYIQSSDDPNREKLRIHAIFSNSGEQEDLSTDSFIGGAYSNVSDLVRGFDAEVLQMAFGTSIEVIDEIKKSEELPSIIPFESKNEAERNIKTWRDEGIFEALLGRRALDYALFNGNKKDKKAFNILREKPDVENNHGRSIAVTHKDAKSLKDSSMGVFMVNLTKGSMIGPHWNPKAAEIAIVIEGQGMVQVVFPSNNPVGSGDSKSLTMMKRFHVKEGDVFVVPRFHPMAQMSFRNSSLVIVGFSSNVKKNHPQFLAGKWSVLRAMKKEIMAASFNLTGSTIEQLLAKQDEAVLLGCDGCAEKLEEMMVAEREESEKEKDRKREKEEEDARRREEERREEEEREARKKEDEKQSRKKEEEAATRKREEEKQKKWEEKEEAMKREEEEKHAREEEEARKREEKEEEKRREEEEKEIKEQEEEEAREEEKEKEEAWRREKEEEEEEARQREYEKMRKEEAEEAAKQREEEKERMKEEEEQRKDEDEKEEEEAQWRWEEKERREREGKKEDEKQRKGEAGEWDRDRDRKEEGVEEEMGEESGGSAMDENAQVLTTAT